MTRTFSELGLPAALVHTLTTRGITSPFPVQETTIPDALAGRDVSGKAPTGSGKTLAYGLPLLARLRTSAPHRPHGLVLAPTRELAQQIKEELSPLAKAARRRVLAVYGGVRYGPQQDALRKGVDLLVATPGRLQDLIEQGSVHLSSVDIVVIDEADRMADMGFLPDVRRLLDQTNRERQTLLFSATLDGDVAVLARDYQTDPVLHEAGAVETDVDDADHHFWRVDRNERLQHTADLVSMAGRSIVFTRTRHGADRLARQLDKLGVGAVALHGGRSQNQRTKALRAFASGKTQALIATDVAARGIHIEAVASVIHFDPAADHKDYLHRSGRTARAGAGGTVVTLVAPDQQRAVRRMQKLLDIHEPITPPRLERISGGRPALPERQQKQHGKPSGSTRRRQRTPGTSQPRHPGPVHTNQPESADLQSIKVGNLPWEATHRDVAELFGRYGKVHRSTIITNRRTGRSKGYGFVAMAPADARVATEALRGFEFAGRPLSTRLADTPQRRS